MALFRKFFYRKPPDGLLEISEKVYVFDCCFTTDIWEGYEYKVYIRGIVGQLRDHFPDASYMVFNFREGENQSQIANILSDYDMTVMDYPRHYEGCPLLTMEIIHHFLRSSESWLSLGQQNFLLMHCERGGWPVLAFMLAALLIYQKQFNGEQKTLDMIYKQAPRELLQLMSSLNPVPSQLRYLQYVSRRNVGSEWPPLDRALTLDCIILRYISNMDGEGGCHPIFRIYGQDPFMAADRTPKVLFSTPNKGKLVRHYKQAECEIMKIDIHCHIQGDVVLECITLENGLEREIIMFRVMFNTAFIRSNILMLNRDEIDILWNAKDNFPKDFRAEVLFSEIDSVTSVSVALPGIEDKEGLPIEAFAKVQEIFSNVDWLDSKTDVALNVLQQISALNGLHGKLDSVSAQIADIGNEFRESIFIQDIVRSKASESNIHNVDSTSPGKQSRSFLKKTVDDSFIRKKMESQEKCEINENITKNQTNMQESQIAFQQSSQPNIISQIVPQASLSSPVSYSNSLQGSPVPTSRYHSEPSAVGITALLCDNTTSDKEEEIITHPVALAPSSTLSKFVKPDSTPPPLLSFQSLPNTHATYPKITMLNTSAPSLISYSSHSPTSMEVSSSSFVKKTTLPPPPSSSEFPSLAKDFILTPNQPPFPGASPSSNLRSSFSVQAPPQPPPLIICPSVISRTSFLTHLPPPPPPPPSVSSSNSFLPTWKSITMKSDSSPTPPPPPPPPPPSETNSSSMASSPPPPPTYPTSASMDSVGKMHANTPPVPPPAAPLINGVSKAGIAAVESHFAVRNGNAPSIPGPPASILLSGKGRSLSRASPRNVALPKKANLKPYHWLKLTRAMQGSLWAETQKTDEASKAPEFDMSELESLFSTAVPNSDQGSPGGKSNRRASGPKYEKVQLIELRRAYNCEIMLSKVKVSLPDLMSSLLALDESALDGDQIENLIKFSPTKEEMDLLKSYNGAKENLGKCEQFFLELMKVPRVEAKLRVFSFKIQFSSQVSELRNNLNVVNSVAEEIRNSVKLKRIMQTILSLGNALNHGTARGSAIGFRLDSLLKLTDTRAQNNKMTLMHYLCKVLSEKLPDLLDFPKDLVSLESSSKIQLKFLAEEMQAVSKGLEKVVQELIASENDGPVLANFCKPLKEFLSHAEAEVRSLASLYSNVGRSADALALYFGEDPARCSFEQVVSTMLNFVRMFIQAHSENCKHLELEKKKEQKETEDKMMKFGASSKEPQHLIQTTLKFK